MFFHIYFAQQTVVPYNGTTIDNLFVKKTDGTPFIETMPSIVATDICLVRLPIEIDQNNLPHTYNGEKLWTTRAVLMPWNSDEVIFCVALSEPRKT